MNFFLYFRALALLIELQFLINLRGFITFKYSIISPKCSPFVGIKVNTNHLVAKSAVNQGFMWNYSPETCHIGKYSTRASIQGAFYLMQVSRKILGTPLTMIVSEVDSYFTS